MHQPWKKIAYGVAYVVFFFLMKLHAFVLQRNFNGRVQDPETWLCFIKSTFFFAFPLSSSSCGIDWEKVKFSCVPSKSQIYKFSNHNEWTRRYRIIERLARPFGTLSPTTNPGLPSPSLNYIPDFHTQTCLLKTSRDGDFHGQPVPTSDHPFKWTIFSKYPT